MKPTGKYLKIDECVGSGAYGEVYRCTSPRSKQEYALKVNLKSTNVDFSSNICEMSTMLYFSDHPCIAKICKIQPGDPFEKMKPRKIKNEAYDDTHLILEPADCDLWKKLKQPLPSMRQRKKWFIDLLLGLEFLHSRGVIHRDLKPGNLLIFNNQLKIADFGMVRTLCKYEPFNRNIMTREYRAPEVVTGIGFGDRVDLWSLGCILYEMITGVYYFYIPSRKDNNNQLMNQIISKLPHEFTEEEISWLNSDNHKDSARRHTATEIKIKSEVMTEVKRTFGDSRLVIELIEELLNFDPHKRPSTQEILRGKYASLWNDFEDHIQRVTEFIPPGFPDFNISINRPNSEVDPGRTKSKNSYILISDLVLNLVDRNNLPIKVFFHAIEVFDRLLRICRVSDPAEEDYRGDRFITNNFHACFLSCLYLCIKFFQKDVSFRRIHSWSYLTLKLSKNVDMDFFSDLELQILRRLSFVVYIESVYELMQKSATVKNEELIRRLIRYCEVVRWETTLGTLFTYVCKTESSK